VRIVGRLAGIAVLALALVGCGAKDDRESAGEMTADAASRVDTCSDRLVAHVETEGLSDAEKGEIRRYARTTYCSRFAGRGWVNDDGTLSIAAQEAMQAGGEEKCAGMTETGEETVPCEQNGTKRSSIACSFTSFHGARSATISRTHDVESRKSRYERRHSARRARSVVAAGARPISADPS
jgi:hypothetical protein